MVLRQYLRQRRAKKRIAADTLSDARLQTEAGRSEYWAEIGQECAESSLIHQLEHALKLPGDIAECGVYRGASLRRIAKTVKEQAPEKTVFGLDSFEGFPDDGVTDKDTSQGRSVLRLAGKFKDADDAPARLEAYSEAFGLNIDLRKGYFESTLPTIADRNFCFLHIDCDTYSGHVEVLNALYERLTPGGCIVFDDYHDDAWPGATEAVDAFFGKRQIEIQLDRSRTNAAWYAVKPTEAV